MFFSWVFFLLLLVVIVKWIDLVDSNLLFLLLIFVIVFLFLLLNSPWLILFLEDFLFDSNHILALVIALFDHVLNNDVVEGCFDILGNLFVFVISFADFFFVFNFSVSESSIKLMFFKESP